MLIIGIDPGSVATGYGILEFENHEVRYVESGRIDLARSQSLDRRLRELFERLSEVMDGHLPAEVALETVFYHKNFKAALTIGHVRGVVMLLAALKGTEVFEYSPQEIKRALVGYGRASKEQVVSMAKNVLGIRRELTSDEADALAVAMCHANRFRPGEDSDNSTARGARKQAAHQHSR